METPAYYQRFIVLYEYKSNGKYRKAIDMIVAEDAHTAADCARYFHEDLDRFRVLAACAARDEYFELVEAD